MADGVKTMTSATQPHLTLRRVLAAIWGGMRAGRKRYVLGFLALCLGAGILGGLWCVVPVIPKATIRAGNAPTLQAFTPDGKTLITSGDLDPPGESPIQLWDVDTGRERLHVVGNWSALRKVLVAPDGKVFAAIDRSNDLTLLETGTGKQIGCLTEDDRAWTPDFDSQFSPDGRFLIFQEPTELHKGRFLIFWEVQTKAVRARLEGYNSDLTAAKDGKQMALYERVEPMHFRIKRWCLDADFPDAGPFQQLDVVAQDIAISPRLDSFAFSRSGADPATGDEIVLADMNTGMEKEKVLYRDPDPANNHIRFSPNGKFLTVDNPHRFNWIRRTPPGPPPLWDVDAGLKPVAAQLDTLHISADDRWLLAHTANGEVELYDTATFRKRGTVSVPTDWSWGIMMGQTFSPSAWDLYQFTPDSRGVLVTGKSMHEKGNRVAEFLGNYIPALQAKHPDVVRLWDVETGQQIAALADCREALYSPDGQSLATVHRGGVIKVWDVPPRKPVLAIIGTSLFLWLSVLVGVQLWQRFLRMGRGEAPPPRRDQGATATAV
jgi:WD40 repeat protein